MLRFNEYLIEMAAYSSQEAADDKGKLHELLLAKYLNPRKDQNGEGILPSHHRSESDEYGGTPHQVHDKLKQKVKPTAYNEIDSHARQTASAILKHLSDKGLNNNHISDVFWTSNRDTMKKAGDHEKTTGIKDVNANADLILRYKHPETGELNHVGISAKHGELEPNYRNDGLGALEKKSGLKTGTLTDIQKQHDQDMADRLGYVGTKQERHAQYKVGRKQKAEERAIWKEKTGSNKGFMPQGEEALRARAAEDASVVARKKMARHLDAALGNMSEDQLKNFIRGQVSPPTSIYHVVAHSQVQDDGSAISKVGDMSKIADDHLNQFKNIRVKKGTGIYTQIVGDYNGKERTVGQQILKTGSGPVKGSAGAFKLSALPKPKKEKPVVVKQPKQKTVKSVQPTQTNISDHISGKVGGIPFYSKDELL